MQKSIKIRKDKCCGIGMQQNTAHSRQDGLLILARSWKISPPKEARHQRLNVV